MITNSPEALLIRNPVNSKCTQDILKGVNILLKYYPNGDFYALHDQLFFGDSVEILSYEDDDEEPTFDLSYISKEDLEELEQLGWFVGIENEMWCSYV